MSCCEKPNIARVNAKCSDLCFVGFSNGIESNGYAPYGINIGGGDYMNFSYCLNCGKIVGDFPVEIPTGDEEKDDDY